MNLILRTRGRHVDGQAPSMTSAFVWASAAVALTAGCGVSNRAQEPSSTTALSADASAPLSSDTPDGGNLCGCSLCKPVVSDDACATDADCAPATQCHATACVARSKAKPRVAGLMCTMILQCNSIDANSCGCLAGHCALAPRASR